jgi:hypothetical protein
VDAKSWYLGWLREDVCICALGGPGSIPVEAVQASNVLCHDLVLLVCIRHEKIVPTNRFLPTFLSHGFIV